MTFENTVHTLHIYFRPIHVNHNTWILGLSLILDLHVFFFLFIISFPLLPLLILLYSLPCLPLLVLLVSLPCLQKCLTRYLFFLNYSLLVFSVVLNFKQNFLLLLFQQLWQIPLMPYTNLPFLTKTTYICLPHFSYILSLNLVHFVCFGTGISFCSYQF